MQILIKTENFNGIGDTRRLVRPAGQRAAQGVVTSVRLHASPIL